MYIRNLHALWLFSHLLFWTKEIFIACSSYVKKRIGRKIVAVEIEEISTTH